MKTSRRFQFWKVFWVVLALYLGMILLALLATSITPTTPGKTMNWRDHVTPPYLAYQAGTFIFIVFYYYFTLNSFYRRFNERKSFISFLSYSIIVLAVLIVYYILSYYISPEKEIKKGMSVGLIIFSYTLGSVFYLGIPLVFSYFVFLRDERKQRKVLEEQKMQLEYEKSQANFNFLKAQINPHFLHNTLNFLYAKALPLSDELSEGILTLSDIMRYALSENNTRHGKALLKDEIEHVRNVIKINQLRYSNKLNVFFDVEGAINGKEIIPFVLITLVENAFKHGDFKSEAHPIRLQLKVGAEGLYFSCTNMKKTGPKELSTGIGLENIRTRLELAYKEQYRFVVKDEPDLYTTELTIYKL
jgi:two-component system LytT family sensor kinase